MFGHCLKSMRGRLKETISMKLTKKEFYNKDKSNCPCCGWQGHPTLNLRKWMGVKKYGYVEEGIE